ncbi:MAG: hypothetical protein LBC87_11475 [Fibromonadaceae bacterium]|nr:hypothetical protein [Fibromonadaceae bacterium]
MASLLKFEDIMLIGSANATIIINITEKVRVLVKNEANCNILIPLDLIFERLSINEKRNGTIIIFIDERIIFNLLKI